MPRYMPQYGMQSGALGPGALEAPDPYLLNPGLKWQGEQGRAALIKMLEEKRAGMELGGGEGQGYGFQVGANDKLESVYPPGFQSPIAAGDVNDYGKFLEELNAQQRTQPLPSMYAMEDEIQRSRQPKPRGR